MQKPTVAELKEAAEKNGAYYVLQSNFPGKTISFPYYGRMSELSVDELNLSVRSSNALKRCGALTAGRVAELMARDGLRTVRNLGAKSEKEIVRSFFTLCYGNMTAEEKAKFWEAVREE